MTVESATYIADLNATLPTSGDPPQEGDNHLRLLKAVLKATFPNLDGPVTLTDEEINALGGGSGSSSMFIPVGGIILWSGLASAIPSGFALCNGDNGTPDLRGLFVRGAGTGSGGNAAGGTGGSDTHTHGGATGATTLTLSQIPAHNHGGGNHRHQMQYENTNQYNISGGGVRTFTGAPAQNDSVATAYSGAIITSQGGGGSHTHTVASADSRPPYMNLCYIMRIS